MTRHLQEMRQYMLWADSMTSQEPLLEVLEESIDVPDYEQDYDALLRELSDLKFKLRSFQELNENQQYALGVEQGYAKAAELIERLLEKYLR